MEPKNYFIEQFKESMAHARHLETLRARHMAFFFTVFFASVGVAASALKDYDLHSISTMTKFMLGLWFWFLDVMALLMLISVKKIGLAHARHSKIITWTREHLFEKEILNSLSDSLGEENPVFRYRFLSVQFVNEAAILIIMVVLDLVLYFGFHYGFFLGYLEIWQCVIFLCLLLITVIFQILVYAQPWVSKQQTTNLGMIHDQNYNNR